MDQGIHLLCTPSGEKTIPIAQENFKEEKSSSLEVINTRKNESNFLRKVKNLIENRLLSSEPVNQRLKNILNLKKSNKNIANTHRASKLFNRLFLLEDPVNNNFIDCLDTIKSTGTIDQKRSDYSCSNSYTASYPLVEAHKILEFYSENSHESTTCGIQNGGNRCYFNATLKALFACPSFRKKINNFTVNNTLINLLIEVGCSTECIEAAHQRNKSLDVCMRNLQQVYHTFDEHVSNTGFILSHRNPLQSSIIDIFAESLYDLIKSQNILRKYIDEVGLGDINLPGIGYGGDFPLNTFKQQDAAELFNQLVSVLWNSNDDMVLRVREYSKNRNHDTQSNLVDEISHMLIFKQGDSIQDFFKTMKDQEECKSAELIKQGFIGSVSPDLLPIQISRYMQDGKTKEFIKDDRSIDIPLIFEANLQDDVIDRQVIYALRSIIIHSGISLEEGHYYTYIPNPHSIVRGENNVYCASWFKHNDSKVSELNVEKINNDIMKNAYIIFYEKII